jgi:hypothetical protein
MATAFYGTITIQNLDGTIQADRFDSTDVTTAMVTFKSVGGETQLTVLKDGHIKDICLNITSAGDTKDFKLWLNQRDTNIRWVQSANFPTVDNRFTNLCPIPVTAGSKIQIEAI